MEVHRLHHMFSFYLTVVKSVYIKKKIQKGQHCDYRCHVTVRGSILSPSRAESLRVLLLFRIPPRASIRRPPRMKRQP